MQNIILDIFKSAAYPPTEDQLVVVRFFFNNIWFLRIFSLVLLLLALFFWYKTIIKLVDKKVSLISCLIIFLTPAFYVLWLSYPIDCLKILLLMFLVWVLGQKRKLLMVLGSIFIILFSFWTTKERASFVYKIGFKDAKTEVQDRFAAEDQLTDPVKVPLKIKRIVYNKYFIEYKELINEVIPFFDMETLFFQEIHPLEQKSVVIFVWPEIFLFAAGTYLLIKGKNKKLNYLLVAMFFISLINFLFDPFTLFRRFEVIIFPIGLIVSLTIKEILQTKIMFGKICGMIILFLGFYGLLSNYTDLNKRPDFWLDNRPYFYEFVFNSIKTRKVDDFDKVYVTSLVGNTDKYCHYYLNNCDQNKFIFDSFELDNIKPEKNSIYAGFAGEFVGSDFKNDINNDWLTLIKDKGFTALKTTKLRDTIAYKFGNDVVVGEIK